MLMWEQVLEGQQHHENSRINQVSLMRSSSTNLQKPYTSGTCKARTRSVGGRTCLSNREGNSSFIYGTVHNVAWNALFPVLPWESTHTSGPLWSMFWWVSSVVGRQLKLTRLQTGMSNG